MGCINKNPELRDVRDFANLDLRAKEDAPTLPDEGEGASAGPPNA